MLSRIAEDLFWLGRYLERAESVARMVDVHYHARLEHPGAGDAPSWEAIVAQTGELARFRQQYGSPTEEGVLTFLLSDPSCPNSVVACLARARENARGIREHLSVEMWEELNKFYLFVDGTRLVPPGARGESPHAFLQQVKTRAYLVTGVADATLLRDEGWQFLRLGTFLERLAQTARMTSIQTQLLARGGTTTPHQWIALLKSFSAFEAYRRLYAAGFAPDRALELLLLHRLFPRSAYFAAAEVSAALRAIAGTGLDRYSTGAEREAARLWNTIAVSTIEDVWAEGAATFVGGIISGSMRIGDAVVRDFFSVDRTAPGGGQP